MGIRLDETQKNGLEKFYYLDQYDSFYLVVGDTNFDWCTITSGIWKSDNELILEYTKEYGDGQWHVVLKKTDNGYLFVSNEKQNKNVDFFTGTSKTSSSHTGIITGVSSSQITVISGNHSDMVAEHTYKLTDSSLVGFASPNY